MMVESKKAAVANDRRSTPCLWLGCLPSTAQRCHALQERKPAETIEWKDQGPNPMGNQAKVG